MQPVRQAGQRVVDRGLGEGARQALEQPTDRDHARAAVGVQAQDGVDRLGGVAAEDGDGGLVDRGGARQHDAGGQVEVAEQQPPAQPSTGAGPAPAQVVQVQPVDEVEAVLGLEDHVAQRRVVGEQPLDAPHGLVGGHHEAGLGQVGEDRDGRSPRTGGPPSARGVLRRSHRPHLPWPSRRARVPPAEQLTGDDRAPPNVAEPGPPEAASLSGLGPSVGP